MFYFCFAQVKKPKWIVSLGRVKTTWARIRGRNHSAASDTPAFGAASAAPSFGAPGNPAPSFGSTPSFGAVGGTPAFGAAGAASSFGSAAPSSGFSAGNGSGFSFGGPMVSQPSQQEAEDGPQRSVLQQQKTLKYDSLPFLLLSCSF